VKRYLYILPLLFFAPAIAFFGSYCSGLGIFSWGAGFVIGAFGMFVVPWLVSILFAILGKVRWTVRLMVFVGALFIQGLLVFYVVPPGATCEMMGLTSRVRHEFSSDQLRNCADRLRMTFHDGTLKLRKRDDHDDLYFLSNGSAVAVEDTELPTSLRGRFQRVFIQTDPSTGAKEVIFALDYETGIICENHVQAPSDAFQMIADGVVIYHYEP
jgi:hypothetical protein